MVYYSATAEMVLVTAIKAARVETDKSILSAFTHFAGFH